MTDTNTFGFYVNGLPNASAATSSTPGNGTAKLPMDTGLTAGQSPQTVAVSAVQIGAAAQGEVYAVTYAATITIDGEDGNFFSLTMGAGNAALTFENMDAGQIIYGKVTQDGVGSRLITVANASSKTSGTPLSTSASATDLVAFMNVAAQGDTPVIYYWPVAKAFA